MGAALPPAFYARPTLEVARGLIGKVLVHAAADGTAAGIIVEVEAYVGESDPACHAAAGYTRRNAPLYGPAGRAYVYVNYGLHHLVNAVTEVEGTPAAVLIRALEPLDGLRLMRRRRAAASTSRVPPGDAALCRGPGNLTAALGITLDRNRTDLSGKRLFIEDRGLPCVQAAWSPRIGLTVGADRPWRCYAAGNPHVSKSGWGYAPSPGRPLAGPTAGAGPGSAAGGRALPGRRPRGARRRAGRRA